MSMAHHGNDIHQIGWPEFENSEFDMRSHVLCAAKKNSFELNNRIDFVYIFLVKFPSEFSDWMPSGASNWISILHRIFASNSECTGVQRFQYRRTDMSGGWRESIVTRHDTENSTRLTHFIFWLWTAIVAFRTYLAIVDAAHWQPANRRSIFLFLLKHICDTARSSSISAIIFFFIFFFLDRNELLHSEAGSFRLTEWNVIGIRSSTMTISLQRPLYFHLKCTNLRIRLRWCADAF